MIRSSFALFLLIALAGCVYPSTAQEHLVNNFMKEGEVPGLFVAVVRGDSVLYQKSFGVADKERGIPMTSTTCMELGSISKAFTAQVIYDLHHQHLLNVDDPITRYLLGAPAAWDNITLKHLLSHTSGIQNYLLDPRFRAGDYFMSAQDPAAERFFSTVSTDSMMRMFYSLPVEFLPGTGWAYSNTGYYLLGKIAEAVTGKNAFDLVKERLTTPLNMPNTQANELALKEGCLATGYFKKAEELQPSYVLTSNYAYSAGAWATTGQDMINYLKAIHQTALPSDRSGFEWNRVDSSKELPFAYEGGRFHTTFRGLPIIAHNGGTPGFSSSWICAPDKNISIIVLINRQDYAPIDQLAWDVLALYEPALQYPDKKLNGAEARKYTQLVTGIVNALKRDVPCPDGLAGPLKNFMESSNGKGLWKWYFERGFPDTAYCVDIETNGTSKAYRFRLPLSKLVEYRLTALINSKDELVQLRWW